ncbi:hypothetical protein Anas_06578, partial [Armadillidium nasatum]
GYILPAFIPNIPIGFDSTIDDDLDNLPQIHLLPTTTLLAPDFRIPAEVLVDVKRDIDITFVEFILRLPEPAFKKVIHLPKKDFILTLFPTLFRETMRDFKYDPVKHYHPNLPHKGIVKEHHHHHHIHTPPPVEKVPVLEHPIAPFKGEGYPTYVVQKEEHHVHHVTPSPPIHHPELQKVPVPNIPFEHVVSQLLPESHKEVHVVRHPVHPEHPEHPGHPEHSEHVSQLLPESHKEVHVVRHPVHPEHFEHPAHPEHPANPSVVEHYDHPRLTIPHGGISFEEPPLSFETSSYIEYQEEPTFPVGSTFHQRESGLY